ncbi:MAG: hypothetical protein KBE09_04120 [Candidatus Pacebacteria bacterium]|nr:hypothetical protein [Candidatus Paceibacterota bacterium]
MSMSNFGSTTVQWVVFAAVVMLAVSIMGGRWLGRRTQRNKTIFAAQTGVDAVLLYVHERLNGDRSNLDQLLAEATDQYVGFRQAPYREGACAVLKEYRARQSVPVEILNAFDALLHCIDIKERHEFA